MGTILASAVILKARVPLFDAGAERFTDANLLAFLNEGQRAISTLKPTACVTNDTVAMTAGTKQTLPAGATVLIDIPRNVDGRVIRQADRKLLDAKAPNWHLADEAAEVRHFMYSIDDPRHWYCYPPNDGTGEVEMIFGDTPADVTINQAISIDDIYEIPLQDYILYRAFGIDDEHSADQNRSNKHLQAFIAALTGKVKGEDGARPAEPRSKPAP